MWATPVWPQLPSHQSALNLPSLGDGADISLSAERRLGDRIARELYRDPDYLEDPVLDEYLQSLWQPLVKGAQVRGDLSPELQERFAWKILIFMTVLEILFIHHQRNSIISLTTTSMMTKL